MERLKPILKNIDPKLAEAKRLRKINKKNGTLFIQHFNPDVKNKFKACCAHNGITMAQCIEVLMRMWIASPELDLSEFVEASDKGRVAGKLPKGNG